MLIGYGGSFDVGLGATGVTGTGSVAGGLLNPLFNSGDRLSDEGNTVDVAGKAAEALSQTLPFLVPVAKKLGPVGMTISVVKAGRDFYNCVR